MKNLKYSATQIAIVGVFGILLTGCGGGSSGTTTVPPTATINGIAVPPEPDATLNAATIAGVDSNNNGVRDDVERVLATNFGKDSAKYQEAINLSKSEQLLVTDPSTANRNAYIDVVNCNKLTAKELDPLTRLQFNSRERRDIYIKVLAGATSTVGGCAK